MSENVRKSFKSYNFVKLMQNPSIVEDLAHKIYERDRSKIRDLGMLKYSLKYSDKELFMKFRDSELTYD
jgi:hypothetical protein